MIFFSLLRHFPELQNVDTTARQEIVRSCQRDAALKIQRSSVALIGAILLSFCVAIGFVFNAVLPALLFAVFVFSLWWRYRVLKLMKPLIQWELKRYLRQHAQLQLRTVNTWIKSTP